MENGYARIKEFVAELGYAEDKALPDEQMLVISDPDSGISNLVIDCEEEIVILEQFILDLQGADAGVLTRLLQINRELVHGALALDESGRRVVFRDTLALENLDLNELDGSIKAISLMLAEHADELIGFAREN